MLTIAELFDLRHTQAADYLRQFIHPWEALDGIAAMIAALGASLPPEYEQRAPQVWVHKSAAVAPTAYLGGPCIVGANSEVRHGAFVRENALIGRGCVVGNSVEIKNAILFDGVQAPHYNYIGDSILGYHSHMGAGAITSNFKADGSEIVLRCGEQRIPTGRQKIGAMLGDYAEIGCNCVLNPGTVIGRETTVYPLTSVRGVIPARHIMKSAERIVRKE